MLKTISTAHLLRFNNFDKLTKTRKISRRKIEKDVEKSFEEIKPQIKEEISKEILKILDNITVYPPFLDKEKIIKIFSQYINESFEINEDEIKSEIIKILKITDPLKIILDYIEMVLNKEAEQAEKEIERYQNYILDSDLPIDFLDDMVVAHHYAIQYYAVCFKLIKGITLRFSGVRRSGRRKISQIRRVIFRKLSAYLEDLNELVHAVLSLELFVLIWSAKDYDDILKEKVEWTFSKIPKNRKVKNEFNRLHWELKKAIERVRQTKVIFKYGDLWEQTRLVDEETRNLWNDLLLTLS